MPGSGGAIVALADAGVLELPAAVGLVDALMGLVALAALIVAVRVPRAPTAHARTRPGTVPLEHL